jgi:hypothetical protein
MHNSAKKEKRAYYDQERLNVNRIAQQEHLNSNKRQLFFKTIVKIRFSRRIILNFNLFAKYWQLIVKCNGIFAKYGYPDFPVLWKILQSMLTKELLTN